LKHSRLISKQELESGSRRSPVSHAREEIALSLPPIPGVIIIPNNIGFLHQYFSALLMVSNGAPALSGLVVKDLTATIILPLGDDKVAATNMGAPKYPL